MALMRTRNFWKWCALGAALACGILALRIVGAVERRDDLRREIDAEQTAKMRRLALASRERAERDRVIHELEEARALKAILLQPAPPAEPEPTPENLEETLQKIPVRKRDPRIERVIVQENYGALFPELQLPLEKEENLRSLLADRNAVIRDAADLARAAKGAAVANPASRSLLNELDAQIRQAIGDDKFAVYQEFVAAQAAQHWAAEDAAFDLADAGVPLNETQRYHLVRALYRGGNAPSPAADSDGLTDKDRAALAQLSSEWTPAQLERLREHFVFRNRGAAVEKRILIPE